MNKQIKAIILGSLVTLILTLSLYTGANQKGLATNSETGLSNKKIEWGIQRKNNLQGTFFITAHYVNTASDLVQRMIDENHIVRQSHHKSQVNAKFVR